MWTRNELSPYHVADFSSYFKEVLETESFLWNPLCAEDIYVGGENKSYSTNEIEFLWKV